MIYSTSTVPVNPRGEVPLTRLQAWSGLVLKARDASEFLPSNLCTRCDIVEEHSTHIVREATISGIDLREIITFEPETKVIFLKPPVRGKQPSSTSFSRTNRVSFIFASTVSSACAVNISPVPKSNQHRCK